VAKRIPGGQAEEGPSRGSPPRRVLRRDTRAASHLVYFLVSASLFIPLVGGMLYFMRDVSESQMDPAAGLEARSRDVLEKITLSPGRLHEQDWNGTPLASWGGDPRDWDQYGEYMRIGDVGIARHDQHRLVSAAKILNLQQGRVEADPDNAYLDYEEMHESLRLDDRFDFYLRMEPIRTDLRVDPFGTKPIAGTHVAYVAALTSDTYDPDTQEWFGLTQQASREIDALKALGLGAPSAGTQGFDGKAYLPQKCGLGGHGLRHGTVIGDTAMTISGPSDLGCVSPQDRSYAAWFSDYMFLASGDRRFDVIIFGSDVDLDKWRVHGDDRFLEFVEDGGTIVFLTNENAAGFVTDCTGPPCLFDTVGTTEMDRDDRTHQILLVPNAVPGILVASGTPWSVCNDEAKGFFPVYRTTSTDCTTTHLGFTTPERYGEGGGLVILAGLDLAGASTDETSGFFANLVSYGVLRAAYLDYGKELPDDRAIRVANRVMALELPNGSHVSVGLKLYLWRDY
jgi:hypothetical protein